jgi:hypothetical protein
LNRVEVRVQRITAPVWYWDPAALDFASIAAGAAWFVAASTEAPAWTKWYVASGTLLADMKSGETYTFEVRSRDKTGLYSTITTTQTIYDNMAPETALGFPPAGGSVIVSSLNVISGTLMDFTHPVTNISTGTVGKVWVKLRRLDTGQYWNTAAWDNSEIILKSENNDVKVYPSSWAIIANLPAYPANLASGTSYYVTSSGFDNADDGGNIELWGSPRSSTFTFDNTAPATALSSPLDGKYYKTLGSLSGASSDNVGVSTVAWSVQNISQAGPNNCYDPAANAYNQACPKWVPAQGTTTSWSYTFSATSWTHNNQYVICSSKRGLVISTR